MKARLCCLFMVVMTNGALCAVAGPYTIADGTIVKIGPSYQSYTPIGDDSTGATAIEFSVDGFIYGVIPNLDTLVRIDPATGLEETIGSLGIGLDGEADLDEDSQGQLWMLEAGTGRLYTIDRVSGAAELHCQADDDGIYGLVSIDGTMYTNSWLPITPQNPGCGLEYLGGSGRWLERGPDGWIHVLRYQWVTWHWGYDVFYRVQPTSGEFQELGRFINMWGMWGLTFDPTEQPPPPAIPALDHRGIILLIVMLAVAGIAILTRPI